MRGVASVIRARGIDKRTLGIVDESVRLPRSLALLTAFRGSEGPSAPEAGQRPVSQTRPNHMLNVRKLTSNNALGAPPRTSAMCSVSGSLLCYGDPQSLAQLVHRARHKRFFAASRCSMWPWHRTGALVPSRPHPRLAAPATPSQSGRGPLADAGPLDIPQSPR